MHGLVVLGKYGPKQGRSGSIHLVRIEEQLSLVMFLLFVLFLLTVFVVYSLLPLACCLLLVAYCLLQVAYCWLLIAIDGALASIVSDAVGTSGCKLVRHITRSSMASNHSLYKHTPWEVPLAHGSI